MIGKRRNPVLNTGVKTHTFCTSLKPLEKPVLVESVKVSGSLEGATLKLEYHMKTQSPLAWETPNSGFSETLWKKTAFEIFIAERGGDRYWEWNFAAPKTWGAFSFGGQRSRVPAEARRDAGLRKLEVQRESTEVRVEAEIDFTFSQYLAWVTLSGAGLSQLEISLNSISETVSGERVHWALKHAADGQANFHRRDNFVNLEKLFQGF